MSPALSRYTIVFAVAPVVGLLYPEIDPALSAYLQTSTLTPYVLEPFHPINVPYVADQFVPGFVLLIDAPLGLVPAEASNITWLFP